MKDDNLNLPVLYMVPKWKMYKIYGKKGLMYFIPELGTYVSKLKFKETLSSLGLNEEDWYLRWILNITSKSDIPKCKCPGCTRNATFLGPSPTRGYRLSCEDPNHIKVSRSIQMSESARHMYDLNPEFAKNRGKVLSDRYKNSEEMRSLASQRSINRYKDENERIKTSILTKNALHAPGMHEKMSNSQKNSYDTNPDRRLKLSVKGKERYKDEKERSRQSEIAKEIASRLGVFKRIFVRIDNKD